MKTLSTSILLTLITFMSAFSQESYTEIEADDMYFTHKDRKAKYNSNKTYIYTNNEVRESDNQQSPVIISTNSGSSTIVLYDEPFYDASYNPDYIITDGAVIIASANNDYFVKDYNLQNLANSYDKPQTNNYYYINSNSNSPYYTNAYRYGRYSAFSINFSPFGGLFWQSHRPYRRYYDPFYYPTHMGYGSYGLGYHDYYYPSYYNSYSYYNDAAYCYYPIVYSNNYYNNQNYADGTSVIATPRRSRSSVAYYANKRNTNINRRRDNHNSNGEGGRILYDNSRGRSQYTSTSERRASQYNTNGQSSRGEPSIRKNSSRSSNGNIEQNRNVNQSRRTTSGNNVVNISRGRTTQENTSGQRRQNNYNKGSDKRPVNRSSSNTGRYSTPPTNRSNSAVRPNNSKSNNNSSTRSRSTNSRTNNSYSPPRSNSSSRSSYTPPRSSSPSRSSSTQRSSSTPSRSSSTQRSSSGSTQRSAPSSSSSSSSRRKN